MSAVWLSLQVGLLAAVLGLMPAMALGYLLARKRFLGHGLLSALVLVPMVLPPVVKAFKVLIPSWCAIHSLIGTPANSRK